MRIKWMPGEWLTQNDGITKKRRIKFLWWWTSLVKVSRV